MAATELRVSGQPSSWTKLAGIGINYLNIGPGLPTERIFISPAQGDADLHAAQHAAALGCLAASARMRASDTDVIDMAKIRKQRVARRIAYDGGIVTHAVPVTAIQIEPGLPPRGVAGEVPLASVLPDYIREWASDPRLCLKPESEWPEEPPRARVNVAASEWPQVCKLLIPAKQVFRAHGKQVVNGIFGIEQPNKPPTSAGPRQRPPYHQHGAQ